MELTQRLKATGCVSDVVHFDEAATEYGRLRSTLTPTDTSTLALDILCTLSRNVERAVGWSQKADADSLLRLCAAATSDVRCGDVAQRTRALAAAFHLHRYATRQKVKPHLVLQLSSFVFGENEADLLTNYHKTYWVVLVDKLAYVEQLKNGKAKVSGYVPTIAGDVKKVIHLYDAVNFCMENLNILIKKLYHIFSDESPKDLNGLYEVIFGSLLAKSDVKVKKAAILDLYRHINDCFNIIVENASKYNFKPCALNTAVDFTSKLIGRRDVCDCLNLYTKFSQIFEGGDVENILSDVIQSIGDLKYDMAKETYPYLNQIVRTHVESVAKYNIDRWTDVFPASAQKTYVKLITILMERLINSPQVVRCVDCNVGSGLHDALRLSFSARHFVNISLSKGMNIEQNLTYVIRSFDMQARILLKLREMKCPNSEKCSFKAQTDVHNTAITLYKNRLYEHSIRLFDMYVRIEIAMYANPDYSERAYLSRAFYNKAICELDVLKYDVALRDAYLSLVFTDETGLKVWKNMSLVIDIKSKALKQRAEEQETEDPFQMTSVLDASKVCYESNEYGDMKPLLRTVEFSVLLRHEMASYARMWPSLLPMVGVLGSMRELSQMQATWARAECNDSVLWSLYDVCLSAVCSARTLNHPRISAVTTHLLKQLSIHCKKSMKFRIAHCTVMLLKAELDVSEAKSTYGWRAPSKNTSDSGDNGAESVSSATLRDEHVTLLEASRAVDAWTLLLPTLESCELTEEVSSVLATSARVSSAFVAVLLQHGRDMLAAQLAHVCVRLATILRDNDLLTANAGTLLAFSLRDSGVADALSARAASALQDGATSEGDLIYLCQAAGYHWRAGRLALAACLVRYVQLTLLAAGTSATGMELATAHLLEAQALLSTSRDDFTALTSLNALHRHCVQARCSGGRWGERRHRTSLLEVLSTRAGAAVTRAAACVLLARRARVSAAHTLRTASAGHAARAHAVVAWTNLTADDVQVKIDTIKSILGVPPKVATEANEITSIERPMKDLTLERTKAEAIESVLDLGEFKKIQNGPASPYFDVQAFTMPEFLSHANVCECYACQNPWHAVLCLELTGLEAATYFRSRELEVAKNYFNGAMKMFEYVEAKINQTFELFKKKSYDEYVLDIVKDNVVEELMRVEVKILTEYTFYLLSEEDYGKAEKSLRAVGEISSKFIVKDAYVENEVINLRCAFERLKNKVTKQVEAELGIEEEFDCLKLSPNANVVVLNAKTPNVKVEIPKAVKPKIVINADELPAVKRRVIKLNLDEDPQDSEETAAKTKTKAAFKIPIPKTTKAVPEIITPRVTRSSKLPVKAKAVKSKPNDAVENSASKSRLKSDTASQSATENSAEETQSQTNQSPDIFEEDVFYTPMSKPAEQFFTPMSTIKTYGKSLMHQVVKNLENEFRTPNSSSGAVSAEAPTAGAATTSATDSVDDTSETDSSGKSLDGKKNESQSSKHLKADSKRVLKRATSPGKLEAARRAGAGRPQTRRGGRGALRLSPEEPIRDSSSEKKMK